MPNLDDGGDELGLSDDLAVERTVLANQRTLLAYVRTALFLFVSGVSSIKLFPKELFMEILGYVILASSLVCIWIGIYTFRQVNRKIERARAMHAAVGASRP